MSVGVEWRKLWLVLVTAVWAGWSPRCAVAVAQEADSAGPAPKGVVIEEVGEGSALEKAGLRPGDVVWAWERLPSPPANPEADHGAIESVFDWMWLEVEQAPRGTVKLSGERKGVKRLFEVTMGEWGAKVRPCLPDRVLEVYLQGRNEVEAGEIERGVELWSRLTKFADERIAGSLNNWIQLRIGETWADAKAWEKAQKAYLAAWEGMKVSTEGRYRSAPSVGEATWSSRFQTAEMKDRLGGVALHRSQFELALIYFKDALDARESVTFDSLALARSLSNLALVAQSRGQSDLAIEYDQRAQEIFEKLAPGSLELARSLNRLGGWAWLRGRLESASEYFQRAMEIQKERASEGLDLAKILNNLGVVAQNRGQLELAGEHFKHALEIRERLAPDSLDLAQSLINLGSVAYVRDQVELAVAYSQRALTIQEKLAPDSLELANNLNNLGVLTKESTYQLRALAIQENLAPDSLDMAISLHNLGLMAQSQGKLELASKYYQRALEIKEKKAPDSLSMAKSLNNLGAVAYARGQLASAIAYYQYALGIQEKVAPNSFDRANSLNDLGKVMRTRGDINSAEDYFQSAIRTLEKQISEFGASRDVEANFRAKHGGFYRDSIQALIELHRPEDAFATQESSRARAFLALLAERDLIFSEVPEDLDRERRRLAFLYESTQKQIEDLSPRDHAEQIDQLTGHLRDLRRQYDANTEEIRRASPAFAALRYPEPLDLDGVRQALDPGTVMLSYSLGKKQTDLFVLTREGPFRVHSLAIGEESLRDQLARFDGLVQSHDLADRSAQGRFEMAKWFFHELIEPASATIEESDRILLVPEGILHRLPFAALIRETGVQEGHPERGWQYLVEWKPLHTVLSGTVYAELHKLRRQPTVPRNGEPTSVALVAFGDPEYPQAAAQGEDSGRGAITDVYVRDAAERHDIRPLPYTRTEVETIAGLFGSEPVRTYLGNEATEERAKALGKDVRIVHFATHGLLDDDFPMNSALALTIPEQFSEGHDNGLLQVWEIFERVRLDADLVVLSACQTAGGQAQFGEGLIGLSRAFQYAGARSVLATLWSVPDRATAELMSRFYRHVRSGKTWDEALRAAQLALIGGEVKDERGDPASAPYYWAAFQVIGDWR